MKRIKEYIITTLSGIIFSSLLMYRRALADMIMEPPYVASEPMSLATQIAIALILIGLPVLAIIAIMLIHKHKKEEEKMLEERKKAEEQEEKPY